MVERIRLVVDSTTDLPQTWIERWNLAMIPAFVNFGEQSYADDGVALPRREFYNRLATSPILPTTSAMPLGLAEEILSNALVGYDRVLAFTVASHLSSIHNTVRLAAEHVDPKRITVYDSGSLSMGLGWQVAAVAEALENDSIQDVDQLITIARDVRARTEIWATADTLEYLRRGGRINPLIASIGTLLNIKPIIQFQPTQITTIQRVRSMPKAIAALAALVRGAMPIERFAAMHSNFESGVQTFIAQCGDAVPKDSPPVISDVTTAIGVHFGPGALGVALVKAK